ncbi:MAG: chemotaxis-specific protein-glutamate methyltransferase CheB [Proteobacteria bacterium]|nr:chemotaxis-specific protein-glutamate methyltransferase CheB [Pseudomonadota bacterium]
MRVLVVEDSPVIQSLLNFIIGADPRLEVCGIVPSAEAALDAIPRLHPDVISMDIRLPGMDGLEATRTIMSRHPTPIVVIADAVEDRSLHISMNALRSGALSVVEKPAGFAHANHAAIADTIRTQLYIMSQVPVIRQRDLARHPAADAPVPLEARRRTPTLAAIVASTGGPAALARVLGALPAEFRLPILIVQHMGPAFMAGFAHWLDGIVPLTVTVAEHGHTPLAGHAYVAPGDQHLTVAADGTLRLGRQPPVHSQRPSGTVLFQSMARALGPRGLGVLLTGMGEDGAEGMLAMRRAGAVTIAEDETTAVVYGMPAAAAKLGASGLTLPLDRIAPAMVSAARMEAEPW